MMLSASQETQERKKLNKKHLNSKKNKNNKEEIIERTPKQHKNISNKNIVKIDQ